LGLDHKTIRRGIKELDQEPLKGRIRNEGADRKREEEKQIGIGDAIEDLIEPKGDPMSILRWTNKSLKKLKKILKNRKDIRQCNRDDSLSWASTCDLSLQDADFALTERY